MTLSIFERFIGSDRKAVWPTDMEAQGELAVDVLDSVQTIVDVLVDSGQDYRVGFSAEATASTDFAARRIAITAKPLTEGGRPLAEVVDILTGFAVHEVGHARLDLDLTLRVEREWPGKVSPARLNNTMQDVRLERAIIDRFPGLYGVFDPTMEWVAAQHPAGGSMAYGTALDERLNFVTAVARYRPYITVATDPVSQAEAEWWSAFMGQITGSTSDDDMIAMLRIGVAHLRIDADRPKPPAPPPIGPGPDDTGCDFPGGEPPVHQPSSANGDDFGGDDTEGDDGDGDDDTDGDDGEGGDDTEGEGKGDEPGDDAGDEPGDEPGDGDGDGQTEGGEPKDGGQSSDGEGNGGEAADTDTDDGQPDMKPGESLDRVESDARMGDGSGGSGKAITEATGDEPDDVDAGLRPENLDPTMDEVNRAGQDYGVQVKADNERNSERLDAGAFGKLKVRVML